MKIQYMSDLHLEFANMSVPDQLGDVLVLAGDIHVGENAIPWIEQCAKVFPHVIYILGNHEYYGKKLWKLPGEIRESIAGKGGIFSPLTNVYFLDNSTVKIDDVYFHGSTLWSKAHYILEWRMNDFRRITYKSPGGHYGRFTPLAATNLHFTAKNFLKDAVVPGAKNVIVTHHAPSFDMINLARYGDDAELNTGYATEILSEFNSDDINLWISGHTHHATDIIKDGIRSVSNCRGYYPSYLTEGFNPCAYVEV